MSPPSLPLHDAEDSLRQIIQQIYEIYLAIYAYTPTSTDILTGQIEKFVTQLNDVQKAADNVRDVVIPREVIGYVEHGRNPDIYTREFVELAVKQNQYLNGKQRAFRGFRDVLAEEVAAAFPELRDDVRKVLENTADDGETTSTTTFEGGSTISATTTRNAASAALEGGNGGGKDAESIEERSPADNDNNLVTVVNGNISEGDKTSPSAPPPPPPPPPLLPSTATATTAATNASDTNGANGS